MVRKISRAKVAGVFYNEKKLAKVFGGKAPSTIQMSDVRSRLVTHTLSGNRRRK
jgi:hypothetical protein